MLDNGDRHLCGIESCRLWDGHRGRHNRYPSQAWTFFEPADKKKLNKAGFATPRGGRKGAYQNHVNRSNKVIIPFERLQDVDLEEFRDGYVIRLFPEQYFSKSKEPRKDLAKNEQVVIGQTAFVLYRSHDSFESLPPMDDWTVRQLVNEDDGNIVERRGRGVTDTGHYVLRLPTDGQRPKRDEGPPQGIFAPEYADEEHNYLCKCMLAWLIVQASGSPYTTRQAVHLKEILRSSGLDSVDTLESLGIIRRGMTCCPLCTRFIRYSDLHETVSFEDENSLENAGIQVEGTTRSTVVNLFHLRPLVYSVGLHLPGNVAWGHAICNTRLGQRRCYSLQQLQEMDLKVAVVHENGIDTFGWISDDDLMIRSPGGAVWIQLHGDNTDESETPEDDEATSL